MKTFLKITLAFFGALFIAALCFAVYLVVLASGAKFDGEKLMKNENSADFYTSGGARIDNPLATYTPIAEMPDRLKNAFVAVEDKNFYRHRGVDYRRMAGATLKNISSFSFREGASTISQQLIKNTHLSGEKTLKRKAAEVKLARKLESQYSKDQILECYLNTIYFGNGAFGVGAAARFYFSKTPAELSLNECAMLAATVKAPAYYSPTSAREKCTSRKNTVLRLMKEQGYIDESEYAAARSAAAETHLSRDENAEAAYLRLASRELTDIFSRKTLRGLKNGYKVYTYLDEKAQSAMAKKSDMFQGADDYAHMLIDNRTGGVLAYAGSVREIRRSPGSTVKPLLVYAPAVEENILSPLTLVLDEKTDFGGYSPSNYKGKYYGYVSAKFALANSLNVPAVKTLEYLGTAKAAKQAEKLGLPLPKSDLSLALALGGMTEGLTLREIAGAYAAFPSGGTGKDTAFIRKITDEKGKTIYERRPEERRAMSEETAFLMNDMMKETVKSGTLKKLSSLPYELAGKSGTVGTEAGNTDAYALTYTSEYTMAFWLGKESGGCMTTDATGGGYPAAYSLAAWNRIYEGRTPAPFPDCSGVREVALDKVLYEGKHELALAAETMPEKEKIRGYFKSDALPSLVSDRYSNPKISDAKLSVENGQISVYICLEEYYDYRIFREHAGDKMLLFDSAGKKERETPFTDQSAKKGNQYTYYAVPYLTEKDGTLTLGPELKIGTARISDAPPPVADDWWKDDFD